MNTPNERLEYAARVIFGSQRKMAEVMGMKYPQLNNYIKFKNIGLSTADKIHQAGISKQWLMDGTGTPFADNEAGEALRNGAAGAKHTMIDTMQKQLDAKGKVEQSSDYTPRFYAPLFEGSAGNGTEFEETDLMIALDKKYHESMIGIRVRGDSMKDIGIMHDDIIVFDKTRIPKNGDVVVAMVGSIIVVKRLKKNGKQWLLAPENPEYLPIEVDDTVQIKGVYHELRRGKI
jgi:phage repressor protein C with HTH and peptisase S24 domain